MGANFSRVYTESAGNTIFSSHWEAEFNNVLTNFTPAGMDDYSASVSEMRTQTDPGESGTESQPTSLAGELARLRYSIAELKGTTYWYETPNTDLATLSNPSASLHVGLEFDGRLDGASSTTDVLARLINQGAIINAATLSGADVAVADFDSTNKKFGTYSYIIGSGNVMAFPAKHGNPIKGSLNAWYRNLAAGDYIAYNPVLGIEIYVDGSSGRQTVKVTDKTTASEVAKNTFTVQGASTRSGITAFHNCTIKWRTNSEGGASTDLIESEYDGTDEGAQLSAQDIAINPGDGGIWFFGAVPQKPVWDHFSAFKVLPDAEAVDAWTANGTVSGNDVTAGILTLDSTGSASAADNYSKSTNINLSQFTMSFKMEVVTALVGGVINGTGDNRLVVRVLDDSMNRSIYLYFSETTVGLYFGTTTSGNRLHVWEGQLNTKIPHVYTLTASGATNPVVKLYIDHVLVASATNLESDTTATDIISFGDLSTTTDASSKSKWEWFAYSGASATAPMTAGTQGNLDSVGIASGIISDTIIARLQNTKVTDVFNLIPTHGPTLPPTMSSDRNSNNGSLATSSTDFADLGHLVYYLAGDGISEFTVRCLACLSNATSGAASYMGIDVDNDINGQSTYFNYGGGSMASVDTNGRRATVIASRVMILTPGLHEIRPQYKVSSGTANVSDEESLCFERSIKIEKLI